MKTTDSKERQEDKGQLLPLETCNTLEIMLKREEKANSIVEDSFCKLHNMITVHHTKFSFRNKVTKEAGDVKVLKSMLFHLVAPKRI
jgi:glutamyl-tRNA reductase